MSDNENKHTGPASEQIFAQLEEDMEPGNIRDLWLSLRGELNEGGPERVRSYLQAEYERRKAIVQSALNELSNQLEETN